MFELETMKTICLSTISSDVVQDTYGKVPKAQLNTTHTRARRSSLSQQVTARLQRTDTTVQQRQTLKIGTEKDPQKKHRLRTVSQIINGFWYKKRISNMTFYSKVNYTKYKFYGYAFASVDCCLVVTWWERTDLLALVCDVYCDFVTFHLVSWDRCGTCCIDSLSLLSFLLC